MSSELEITWLFPRKWGQKEEGVRASMNALRIMRYESDFLIDNPYL